MTRPWVAITVGVCGLLTLVIAVNHFTNDGGTSGRVPTRMASLAGKSVAEPTGWLGRQDSATTGGSFETTGSHKAGGAVGGSHSGERRGTGGSRGWADAVTGGGARGPDGTIGYSGSSAPHFGGNSIRLSAPDAPAVKFEGGGSRMIGGSASEVALQGKQGGPGASNDSADNGDNGPVLSLSFDGTLEPQKGEAPVVADGVTFDSSSNGATFSTDSQFVIPDAGAMLGQNAGTIAFTIQPDWAGSDPIDASLVQIRDPNQWDNRIQITKNGQYLRFLFTDNTGQESGAGITINNWQPGDIHQVTATWGDSVASLYVDGRLVGQGDFSGQFQPQPTTPLHIGSDFPGGQPGAQATISNFQLYNKVQPPQ